jgi:hypothetical protein
VGFTKTGADGATAVTDNHNSAESESAPPFDHLGGSVNRDYPVEQIKFFHFFFSSHHFLFLSHGMR